MPKDLCPLVHTYYRYSTSAILYVQCNPSALCILPTRFSRSFFTGLYVVIILGFTALYCNVTVPFIHPGPHVVIFMLAPPAFYVQYNCSLHASWPIRFQWWHVARHAVPATHVFARYNSLNRTCHGIYTLGVPTRCKGHSQLDQCIKAGRWARIVSQPQLWNVWANALFTSVLMECL